jgi:hypothetical protein
VARKATTAPRGRRRPRELSAYEKRVQRGLAAGKTLQEARGHKAHEHVERRAREIERYGITTYQKAQIRKFGERHAKRLGTDPATTVEKMQRFVKRRGYEPFKRLRDEVARLGRLKRARVRYRIRKDGVVVFTGSTSGAAKRRGEMERFAEDFADLAEDLGVDTFELLFYH